VSGKIIVATASLAGCFGCHMSILDIDERLADLVELVDLDRSPLTDKKSVGRCDVGIVEGGVCNAENVEVLRLYRRRCRVLVAIGACAINGGVPAMRNQFSVRECVEESYLRGLGVFDPQVPNDPELPLLLDQVHPLHEVVPIDYFLPGCPPPAGTIWSFFTALADGRDPTYAYRQIHYD
jgi:NAD-reducing hydrogenase small subunit